MKQLGKRYAIAIKKIWRKLGDSNRDQGGRFSRVGGLWRQTAGGPVSLVEKAWDKRNAATYRVEQDNYHVVNTASSNFVKGSRRLQVSEVAQLHRMRVEEGNERGREKNTSAEQKRTSRIGEIKRVWVRSKKLVRRTRNEGEAWEVKRGESFSVWSAKALLVSNPPHKPSPDSLSSHHYSVPSLRPRSRKSQTQDTDTAC